jgi:uncharacterized flavoprotein (TIGR03862 family)
MPEVTSIPAENGGVPTVLVIGGGPAGLIAAERLAQQGIPPIVVEGSASPARKFLIAGRGGLNLTHSGSVEELLPAYGGERDWLRPHLARFDGLALRAWADSLGAETFVGTSGRIFPKALKSTALLRAWLHRLQDLGVTWRLRTRLIGFDERQTARLRSKEGEETIRFDACILALGGASWPRLGSDGSWREMLTERGIQVRPFEPANIGLLVEWSEVARRRLAGLPLKNVMGEAGGIRLKGEIQLTDYGVEGQLIYALGRAIREQLCHGIAVLHLDLKPDLSPAAITSRLERPRNGLSWPGWLTKRLNLAPAMPTLLREAGLAADSSPHEIAALIKNLPLRIVGARPIAEAISSAGGVALDEVDERLMFRKAPGLFVAGEMLDWEAPTGGYLLQACFATGVAAADGVASWLRERAGSSRHGSSSP